MPHTLLPDVAAGHLMARGEVDVVLVGADRVAANGDTANKVGTYPLAVLAARHGIPFYVCAPISSVDLDTPDGAAIPIEERKADEVLLIRGVRIAPPDTAVRNPAFDVTPAELITGHRHRGRGHPRRRSRTGCAPAGAADARWARRAGHDRPVRVAPESCRGGRADGHGRARPARRVVARTTTDRALLRDFLERDRLYAAYAICDLEEREFGRTRWGGRATTATRSSASSSSTPARPRSHCSSWAAPTASSAILRDVIRPRAAYIALRPEILPAVEAHYRVDPGPPMVRMWVDRAHFRPYPATVAAPPAGRDRRPQPAVPARLRVVAAVERASPRACTTAIRVNGRLVAAAGTHVVSPTARLAVVGNVLTHIDYRGRGFATAVTGAVTAELLRTCDQVVLNVRADNPPALNAYRRLGYAEHMRFEERLIHRLGSPWPDLTAPLRRLFTRKETDPR